MTVLFASGEDTGFTLIGAVAGSIINSASRSTYARNTNTSVNAYNSTSTADPPANRLQTPQFTSTNTIWVHAQMAPQVSNAGTANEQALIIRSPDGVGRIVVRQTGTAGTLKVSTRNAAGSFVDLATASAAYSTGVITQLDLRVDYIALGTVQLYLGGAQVINWTGDPRTDSATLLDQVDLASINNGNTAATGTCWSEVIVADEDTRGMALWTLTLTGAGTTQSWSPNTLANINKAVINDSTAIASSTANQLSEWATVTTPPVGSWGVKAVVQETRMEVGVTGPQHFDYLLRVASTDYLAGLSLAPTTSYTNFSNQLWPSNPATAADWSLSDLTTGIQVGVKSLT